MSLVHSVHPFEAILNRFASIRNRAIESVQDSRWALVGGLGLAALVGAPMPLPQVALAGPILATLSAGRLGGRAAAAVGFLSYLVINRPSAGAAMAAGALAVLVGWAVPAFLNWLEVLEDGQNAASAIAVNCDGFSSLDATYGRGASAHAFSLLRRALEMETRHSDLVVHAQGQELILVLDGSDPSVAKAVMARVERRFASWLSDAGYDCNLAVGLSTVGGDDRDGARRCGSYQNGPYLD